MNLQGEQIPKATMTAYLKDKFGKTKISTQFIQGVLHISKKYITTIANKANEICTNDHKKTISLDHLYKAIEHFELTGQLEELRKIEQEVKEEVLHKNQIKLNIQKSYNQMTKQRNQEIIIKREISGITMKQTANLQLFNKQSDDEDYEDDQQ